MIVLFITYQKVISGTLWSYHGISTMDRKYERDRGVWRE